VPYGRRAVLLAAIAAVFLVHVAWLWTVQEDAFIGYRYSRNLAEGHGPVWNVGEPPVEGYTDFLRIALMAAVVRAGLPMVRSSQLIGVAFALAALGITAAMARRCLPGAWALVPPLLLATSGPFAAYASSGMDTPIFAFFVVAGVARELVERDDVARLPISGLIFALAAMTRPEGAFVFAITLVHRLLDPPGGRRDLPRTARWALGFVIPFGAYFLWRWTYYGFLLPNTFYAKVGTTAAQVVRGIKYVGKFFIVMAVPALALAGFVMGRRRRAVSLGAAITIPYLAYILVVGGDYMALFRFTVPLLPFMALATAVPLTAFARRLPRPRVLAPVTIAVVVLVGLAPSLNLEALPVDPPPSGVYLKEHRPSHWYMKMRQHTAFPRLVSERWYVNRFTLLGQWMQRELPAGTSVAYYGIGAIGYYCDHPIIDMWGLNDTYLGHLQKATMGSGIAGHEKRDFLYVLRREPSYVLYSRHFSAKPYGASDVTTLYWRELTELSLAARATALEYLARYSVENVWMTDAANRDAGYATFLRLTRCSTDEGCRRCARCERVPAPATGG
jgi:arabinofuranosyltransferase